jgi:hypothetical protein
VSGAPRFCRSCGAALDEGDRFCGACGTAVRAGEPARPSARSTPPPGPAAPRQPSRAVEPSPPAAGGPVSFGIAAKVGLTILLFAFVAFGRRYSAELGEWMESIFGR